MLQKDIQEEAQKTLPRLGSNKKGKKPPEGVPNGLPKRPKSIPTPPRDPREAPQNPGEAPRRIPGRSRTYPRTLPGVSANTPGRFPGHLGTPPDTPCRRSWAQKGPQKSLLFTLKRSSVFLCPSGAVLVTFGTQKGVPFAAEILPGRKKLPVRK